MDARTAATWQGNRLYLGTRLSGYTIVQDAAYPTMWRVQRPDGSLSDMVNRSRAKDAAFDMLDRALRAGETVAGSPLAA